MRKEKERIKKNEKNDVDTFMQLLYTIEHSVC